MLHTAGLVRKKRELLHEQGMPPWQMHKGTVRRTGLCRSTSVTAQIKKTRPAQSKRPESGEGVGALGSGALGLGALTMSSERWLSSRINASTEGIGSCDGQSWIEALLLHRGC